MQTTTHQVTLDVAVVNENRVLDAAARHLVRTNCCPSYGDAVAEIRGDVGNALRLLLDPGLTGDGYEINESACTET